MLINIDELRKFTKYGTDLPNISKNHNNNYNSIVGLAVAFV